ncbi:MAG: response regulator transcription factor [Candidatus Eisenbacteria bacterium]|uniref:Response regulator transcription factor n=1 Tax=Eiseniibacteriota bacterium TaxID=2212470 RepID=A0A956NDD0_UNCEI|nr:response regulator transcription factor [Candidatus Eisenbacteria bacterium]MCB9465440.1 response regulator transcription factor [Candidatus Eisenbacteria bacterium]
MTPTVLVIEDDARISELVAKNLDASGFRALRAADGDRGLSLFKEHDPDLVILDLMIPGVEGLEVCRRIRAGSQVPVLMLTARGDETDKLLGFEVGADDYLTKPFSTRELIARVRALLRRAGSEGTSDPVLRRGDLVIDPARRVVERSGAPIELTSLEFDLLRFLAQRPGFVYTRDQLLHRVWGDDRVVDDRSIDSLVSRLRRKVEADPARPRYVQTVWGTGYRFAEGASGDER